MDTITELVAAHARTQPSAPAYFYRDNPTSYAALAEMGRRAAAGLARLGVERGDRVALWLPNCPAYLSLWLGCAQLGAIAVAVNTRFRSVEVADIIARSGAKVLAMWPGFRGIAFLEILEGIDPGALERLRHLVLYTEDGGDQTAPDLPAVLHRCTRTSYAALIESPERSRDDAHGALGCNIFTTSGTTKAPKFVLHSQRSVTQHARTVAAAYDYPKSAGGILQVLPLCGVFGFCQAAAGLASGRALILMSAFDPEQTLDAIDRYRIETLNATDDMIEALFECTDREVALPGVRYAGFAAFTAEPDTFLARCEARGLKLAGLYGMSEVQAFFARQPLDAPAAERRLGGGRPLDDRAQVRVVDPETGAALPPGEHGEIELRGPSLMSEYFDDPEATGAVLTPDGFVRSGDLGYMLPPPDAGGDPDRFVYLARMGDVLRLGGFLVSPAEIEAHLNTHPAVTGTQVVGVQTDAGPRPVAFVTVAAAGAVEEAGLRAHCAAGLAKFKVPTRILTLDEFPTTKSANGTKIQKAKLREIAEASVGATR